MLVEALICLALISIFLIYLLAFTNNIYKNDFISLEKSSSSAIAREIIEKSSSLGNLLLIEDDKYEIDVKKILETNRRTDYKLIIKNKKSKRVNEYEFSIDKRKNS